MELGKKLEADEIVSEKGLQEFLRAARIDVDNTQGQKEGNKHVRMQVAFQGGAFLEANGHTLPKSLLGATAKLQAGLMGAFGAALEPTAEKPYMLEQTLDQNFQPVEAQRPATVKVGFNAPKPGL